MDHRVGGPELLRLFVRGNLAQEGSQSVLTAAVEILDAGGPRNCLKNQPARPHWACALQARSRSADPASRRRCSTCLRRELKRCYLRSSRCLWVPPRSTGSPQMKSFGPKGSGSSSGMMVGWPHVIISTTNAALSSGEECA